MIEPDAALVAVLAQHATQLVGMHRPLRQIGEHGERQYVADPPPRARRPSGGAGRRSRRVIVCAYAVRVGASTLG